VLHDLRERVKELTALHGTARILQDDTCPLEDALARVVELLPPAWQYPDIACARIQFDGTERTSAGFVVSEWRQQATFVTAAAKLGRVEVFYTGKVVDADEGPFLAEERNLIDSVAEMLRLFLERREAASSLKLAHEELEGRIAERTEALVRLNRELQAEVAERARSEERIRSLAAELSLAEEAERRTIAADLHDRIGQALAMLKLKLVEIQRSAAFSGYEPTLGTMRSILDQAIRATRTLTVEISPPILYELGLIQALQWLGEQYEAGHSLTVSFAAAGDERPDEIVALTVFKAARELFVNTLKHARARRIDLAVRCADGRVCVDYSDDGVGFDPAAVELAGRQDTFGLFNIRERCAYLGGHVSLDAAPGRGVHIVLDLPTTVAHKERSHASPHPAR
jgi:signal transduction histidine kinase